MVTSQGQVLTQALPPGTIQIQNSQVSLLSQTPTSLGAPRQGLIAFCICHKPSCENISLSVSESSYLRTADVKVKLPVWIHSVALFLFGSTFDEALGFFFTPQSSLNLCETTDHRCFGLLTAQTPQGLLKFVFFIFDTLLKQGNIDNKKKSQS